MPKHPPGLRAKWMQNSCTPLHSWYDTAMQYVLNEQETNSMFGGNARKVVQCEWETFYWPTLPVIRQKPLNPDLANNYDIGWFFGHGAHMPIAVFVQSQARRRSLEKYLGRAEKNRKGKEKKSNQNLGLRRTFWNKRKILDNRMKTLLSSI